MFNKLFNKKQAEQTPSPLLEQDQVWPTLPTRQRFRRTRSAASESVYADYESDDWGVAPTILHDREGHELRRSPSINSLEEWQRNTNANANALFRNVSARVRSMSVSRPNWSRAPPTGPAAPTYGWARRVEHAGGPDEKQRRREHEKSRRPVTIPAPNPAPGPIDLRRDDDPILGMGERETSALQAPTLVRRKSSTRDERTKNGRMALGHRSTTSSPTIIVHTQTPGAGPSSSKPSSGSGGRQHLSRVEKIAAVLQHVASLPLFADSPVHTYYPPKDKDKPTDPKVAPAEPFRTYSVPPSVPKRYRPPPVSLPTGWYQPKPPKVKKPKKGETKSRKTKTNLGGVGDDTLDYNFSDEFEYPDFDYGYTGDTPTLQSDESSMFYEQVNPRMIEGTPYTIRPAYFPGPIKSTGLTTHIAEEMSEEGGGRRPLMIMPPPGVGGGLGEEGFPPGEGYVPGAGPGLPPIPGAYGYDDGYDEYDDEYNDEYDDEYDEYESEFSHGPIPSTLTPSGANSAPPPLVIPTPTDRRPSMPFPMPDQPFSRHYEAAPASDSGPPLPGGYGPSASAQGWHPTDRRPSAQGWGATERKPSAQGWGPTDRRPSAQGWGTSPGPPRGLSAQELGIPTRAPFAPPDESGWGQSGGEAGWETTDGEGWGESGEDRRGWGETTAAGSAWGQSPGERWASPPKRRPSAQDWSRPSPMAFGFPQPPFVFGPPHQARGYEPAPQTAYGPSPHIAHGPSPHTAYGPSPHTAYRPSPHTAPGPSPQFPYSHSPQFAHGPSPRNPYGPSPQTAYAPYPYNYYPQTVWDPYGVVPNGFHITDSPRGQHRGDSPPPIPSPIATSVALSRTSRRRSKAV